MPRSARVTAAPGRRDPDEQLTVEQVCAELKVARSTLHEWRAKGRAPKIRKLPNGELRIKRRDLDEWLESCLVA